MKKRHLILIKHLIKDYSALENQQYYCLFERPKAWGQNGAEGEKLAIVQKCLGNLVFLICK